MQKKQSKKWLASAAAMTLAVSAAVPASAENFTDYQGNFYDTWDYEYEASIEGLYKQGIISGYADGSYQPYRELTRGNVVKILGKYLVSLGYKIPSDYKKNMRFTDLKRGMNDEMLQYAALVADYGIFNGSQGKLNYEQVLTRKQMALVLVRALSKIDDFDYTDYVSQQTYMQEYLDIEDADEEAQHAINVFDYYNVTKDDYYYPLYSATRGDFAHHLYRLLNIDSPARNNERPTVKAINVVTDQRLDVTLSDGTKHHVQLGEVLEPNKSTEVTFTIEGLRFTETVEYYVSPVRVTHVENINGAQFVVHFNQPIHLSTTYKEGDLKKVFQLTNVDRYSWMGNDYTYMSSASVPLKQGVLSEDGRSYTITTAMRAPLDTRYYLRINGIYGENGIAMPTYDEVVYFDADTEAPKIQSVAAISADRVKVQFSEPVNNYAYYNYNYYGSSYSYYYNWYNYNNDITFTTEGGTPVTNVGVYVDEQLMQTNQSYTAVNATGLVFDLANARAGYTFIQPGEKIIVKFNKILDVAGNEGEPAPLTTTITKGQRNGIEPMVETIKQIGAKEFEITFNEKLDYLQGHSLEIFSNTTEYGVESVRKIDDDTNTYIVKVDDYLRDTVTIRTAKGQVITDATGEVGTFTKNHVFVYDATQAKVEHTEIIRLNNMEYVYIRFDRDIVFSDRAKVFATGTYTENKRLYPINGEKVDVQLVYGERNAVKVPLKELLKHNDIKNMDYDVALTFEHVENEYKVAVPSADVQIARSKDYNMNTEVLEVVAVHTSRSSKTIKDAKTVVIDFNLPVNDNARSPYFYEVYGHTIRSVQINPANDKQVILTLSTPLDQHRMTKITVVGEVVDHSNKISYKLGAQNSVEKLINFEDYLYFTENGAPSYQFNPTVSFNHEKEIVLTFTEAMKTVNGNEFLVTDQYGYSYKATAMNDPQDARNILLRLEEAMPNYAYMTVQLKPNRTLSDVYHNVGTFKDKRSATYRR